jgi:hypothetical protein
MEGGEFIDHTPTRPRNGESRIPSSPERLQRLAEILPPA